MTNGNYNSARVTFRWRCNACDKIYELAMDVEPGAEFPKVQELPDGWFRINGFVYCNE